MGVELGKTDGPADTPEAWLQVLKDTDFRAMFGILSEIEHLLCQDDTTATQLTEVILKDVALTARVLKVANSAAHPSAPATAEGGVTQAIVRIGFNGLRAVCICISLMDNVLRASPYRDRLLDCIARSFDIAVHARNVGRILRANEEDVFIAGLMQNVGELMFWCSSLPESPAFTEQMQGGAMTAEQGFKQLSGMDFRELSQVLATEWQLSASLLETFGSEATVTAKAVFLGRRISRASQAGWDSPNINQLLQSELRKLGFTVMRAMEFMKQGAKEARALAAGYDLRSKPEKPSASDDKSDSSAEKDVTTPTKKQRPTSLIRR